MTASQRGAPLYSPTFTGTPLAPTQDAGDDTTAIATDEFVQAALATAGGKAILLGKGGLLSDAADCADFPVRVPFDCSIESMNVTVKSAVSGAMVVQARTAAGPITTPPTYSNITGLAATFVSGRVTAAVTLGTAVTAAAGDFLNFSLTTSSGSNVLVEIVAVAV